MPSSSLNKSVSKAIPAEVSPRCSPAKAPDKLNLTRPFFFSSRRRHTRWPRDWSSDVCSSDLAAHLLGQLQRPAAAGGPPAGDHAAGYVVGMEALVAARWTRAHPLVGPRPAVGAVQPGQALVLQQRRDGGMVVLLQLPLAGGLHRDPGAVQRPQQQI